MKYDWLEKYLLAFPGAEHDYKIEWQWDRYMVRGKLFAAICTPEGMKDESYNGHTLVTTAVVCRWISIPPKRFRRSG